MCRASSRVWLSLDWKCKLILPRDKPDTSWIRLIVAPLTLCFRITLSVASSSTSRCRPLSTFRLFYASPVFERATNGRCRRILGEFVMRDEILGVEKRLCWRDEEKLSITASVGTVPVKTESFSR